MTDVLVLIPARMASQRLPGKPLADIRGVPMIVHVWHRAVEAGISPVMIATDSEETAGVIRAAGGDALMTRSDHPLGSNRIHEAARALDPHGRFDIAGGVPDLRSGVYRVGNSRKGGVEVPTTATRNVVGRLAAVPGRCRQSAWQSLVAVVYSGGGRARSMP